MVFALIILYYIFFEKSKKEAMGFRKNSWGRVAQIVGRFFVQSAKLR
jgi:hypothetical protein